MKKLPWLSIWIFSTIVFNANSAETTQQQALATFAGGCFWCMEQPFEQHDGVSEVISGFAGGTKKNPSYKQVARGKTKHVETVQIHYDRQKISYPQLLEIYFRQIDPTDNKGSFVDRGPHYRPVIFFHNDQQLQQAQHTIAQLTEQGRFPKPIQVELTPYSAFYAAEQYHQNYYDENPIRYHYYRSRSGRDDYLDRIWGESRTDDPKFKALKQQSFNKSALKQSLSKLQYDVTQNEATEPSFNNEYWDNKQAGIYVDIISGEPLFSSTDKYRSGTGWPSFTQPISDTALVEKEDRHLFTTRTELRSKVADSHLGHLFSDGPKPTGLRYCINSASLRFVPVAQLKPQGYQQYRKLFN